MEQKIIIAGGSGFLGNALYQYYTAKGVLVKILTRNPKKADDVYWDGKTLGAWKNELENATALINLAGKSVNCRYNKANKRAILSSRIDSTAILGSAVRACEVPPAYWFNSSTATIYQHTNGDAPANTEKEGKIGSDFSMNIAKDWEAVFNRQVTPNTKKVVLRTAIVYGKDGGAFPVVWQLAKRGLCSPQAGGQQWVSWIHEIDFCKAIDYIMAKEATGIFNICAPNPITNKTFNEVLAKYAQPIIKLPQPKWLLQIGAIFIKTEVELILKSRKVYPANLLALGFKFDYENVEDAIANISLKNR